MYQDVNGSHVKTMLEMASLHWLIPVALTFTTKINMCHFNLSYYSKVTALHSERRQQKVFLKTLCLFLFSIVLCYFLLVPSKW